jgi:hypothetical protein
MQIADLLRLQARELGKEGSVKYQEYHHIEGSHKVYIFTVGDDKVVVEVKRLTIVEFDKPVPTSTYKW